MNTQHTHTQTHGKMRHLEDEENNHMKITKQIEATFLTNKSKSLSQSFDRSKQG